MIRPEYQVFANGEQGVTLVFQQPVSETLSGYIDALAQHCRRKLAGCGVEIIPAYQSLTLYSARLSSEELIRQVERLLTEAPCENRGQSRLIEIPVCYAPRFGPDVAEVCRYTGLSKEAVIRLHSQQEYLVHMLGFLPGFLYLGGVAPELACPRKSVPATNVAAGAVGIGGEQTGVYPVDSPGGWQIIGRTPLRLFAPEKDIPFLAAPMDRIRFCPISEEAFEQLLEQAP